MHSLNQVQKQGKGVPGKGYSITEGPGCENCENCSRRGHRGESKEYTWVQAAGIIFKGLECQVEELEMFPQDNGVSWRVREQRK